MNFDDLPRYQCTKQVRGVKIKAMEIHKDGSATIIPENYPMLATKAGWASRFHGDDTDTGYFVVYEDGYQSWSPTKAFEEGYHRI